MDRIGDGGIYFVLHGEALRGFGIWLMLFGFWKNYALGAGWMDGWMDYGKGSRWDGMEGGGVLKAPAPCQWVVMVWNKLGRKQ